MTDIKQPTDADLAQIEALAYLWQKHKLAYGGLTGDKLAALVAALREAWEVVALGHEIADSYEWGECQDADQREFTNRAARIVALAQHKPADGAA